MSNQQVKVECHVCQVVTGYKNFARHMKRKHPTIQPERKYLPIVLPPITDKNDENDANDGSSTVSRQSLWCHKQTCSGVENHSGSGLLYSTNTNRPQVNLVGKTSGNLVHKSKKLEPYKRTVNLLEVRTV